MTVKEFADLLVRNSSNMPVVDMDGGPVTLEVIDGMVVIVPAEESEETKESESEEE